VRQQHEMILSGSAAGGGEEWVCATCTRRIALRWPPSFRILVLDQGDETAIHVGGKGGVSMGASGVRRMPEGEAPSAEVPNSEVHWLRENGIDWDGMSA
jgi:hypothetical protein